MAVEVVEEAEELLVVVMQLGRRARVLKMRGLLSKHAQKVHILGTQLNRNEPTFSGLLSGI